MQNSEADQLNAFCEFIKSNNLIPALQNRNWAQFARAYNGPEYARNAYDTKLAEAYDHFAKVYPVQEVENAH